QRQHRVVRWGQHDPHVWGRRRGWGGGGGGGGGGCGCIISPCPALVGQASQTDYGQRIGDVC
ncbi:unnamed protein product, partial [Phaeothamnion confervicola]